MTISQISKLPSNKMDGLEDQNERYVYLVMIVDEQKGIIGFAILPRREILDLFWDNPKRKLWQLFWTDDYLFNHALLLEC